jgi:hypothetical protein
MDLVGIIAVIAGVVVLALLVWRPLRHRRGTVDEALAADALRREQDENLTDAVYEGDKLGIRSPRRIVSPGSLRNSGTATGPRTIKASAGGR